MTSPHSFPLLHQRALGLSGPVACWGEAIKPTGSASPRLGQLGTPGRWGLAAAAGLGKGRPGWKPLTLLPAMPTPSHYAIPVHHHSPPCPTLSRWGWIFVLTITVVCLLRLRPSTFRVPSCPTPVTTSRAEWGLRLQPLSTCLPPPTSPGPRLDVLSLCFSFGFFFFQTGFGV